MNRRWFYMALLILLIVAPSNACRDRGSWKKSLHEKALCFEKQTKERHNILGSYPSCVPLVPPRHYAGSQEGAWKQLVETGELPPGWIVDHGTTGVSNIAHTSSWTGCYLTAEAFRVAFLRDRYGVDRPEYQEAYARANEVISAFRVLTLVSGRPGFLARGIALGHGISYEERAGVGTRDLWAQGAGEYSYLRYRGGPSHHNYDHVFRGLGMYYFVAADDRQKEAIREIVADMSDWAHLENNMVVMHADGKHESTVLIGGWRAFEGTDRPSGSSLMATTGLKIAAEITGNEKVERLYEKWTDALGYRNPEMTAKSIMGKARDNYDDTDHLLGDLYLLNLIEKDPELLSFYRKCVKDSWEVHKEDKYSWFNFVYWAVLGEEYGDPEGSLWNLQSHPTCRIFQPQMNSIRKDLELHPDGRSLPPLPVYERPSDNEYEWKISPYELDGWLSRIVSVLEVSPHDPYVQFAADTSGYSYWSNTNGEIWHAMGGLPLVRKFLFSTDYPWIAFAATSGGIYRTTDQGRGWGQVFPEAVESIEFDPDNSYVLYAVGPNGVFKSSEARERDLGTAWRSISGYTPCESQRAFAVDPRGEHARLYLLTRDGLYVKTEGDTEWTAPARMFRTRDFSSVEPLVGSPLWIRVDDCKKDRLFRAVQVSESEEGPSGPILEVSDNGGKTWSPILRKLKPALDWVIWTEDSVEIPMPELMAMMAEFRKFPIRDVRVDRHDPKTWYGLMDDGIAVTHDDGETWTKGAEGLDIPRVGALWTPRHSSDVYVGTPAGMYVSHDRSATWEDTSLILQGDGAIRSEIGGIGYLTAYWMGRYHGFITDEQATAQWWLTAEKGHPGVDTKPD